MDQVIITIFDEWSMMGIMIIMIIITVIMTKIIVFIFKIHSCYRGREISILERRIPLIMRSLKIIKMMVMIVMIMIMIMSMSMSMSMIMIMIMIMMEEECWRIETCNH